MDKIKFTIIQVLALLVVLISHELSHGYVAYLNGDKTAKLAGRLSINPLKHLDPLGTLMMIVVKFGWAKPVPINPYNFKRRRLGLFLVSIAGVVTNLLTAFLSIGILIILDINNPYIVLFFRQLALYGIVFGVFNLIPIPPLDGSKVLASFLPPKFEDFIYKHERVFFFILLGLLWLGVIDKFIVPIAGGLIEKFILFYLNVLGAF